MNLRRRALVVVFLLVVTACSSGDDPLESSGATSTTVEVIEDSTTTTQAASTTVTTSGDDAPTELPGTVEAAAGFTLGLLNGEEIDEATYDAVFADAFRNELTFDDFVALLPQLTPLGPWTVDEVLVETETELAQKVDSADGSVSLVLELVIEPDDELQIDTLFLSPWFPPAEVESIDDGVAALQEQGALRMVIAETTDGVCTPIQSIDADQQAPLGSVFKLYVLKAIVTAVDSGEIAWDDLVEVRDELDSIPSGVTQDEEPGTELSVRELAERMIEISDNTATDHLIELVGRDAVIASMAATGHDDPSINEPFMTTREFTIIKFSGDDLVDRWLAADTAGRQAILDDEVSSMDLPPVDVIIELTDPVSVNEIEWFASPNDLCELLIDLSMDEAASEIMQLNPGGEDETSRWESIGFKGGSEPGVLVGAWIMTDESGRSYVLAASVSNEDQLVDETVLLPTMIAIRDLIDG